MFKSVNHFNAFHPNWKDLVIPAQTCLGSYMDTHIYANAYPWSNPQPYTCIHPHTCSFAQSAGAIHQLHLCKGVRIPSNECHGYDTKQSDGEVPVMLEL